MVTLCHAKKQSYMLFWWLVVVLTVVVFQHRVSLYRSGYAGTHYVAQCSQKSSCLSLPRARITYVSYPMPGFCAPLQIFLFKVQSVKKLAKYSKKTQVLSNGSRSQLVFQTQHHARHFYQIAGHPNGRYPGSYYPKAATTFPLVQEALVNLRSFFDIHQGCLGTAESSLAMDFL